MILCQAFGPSFFKGYSFTVCPYMEFFVSVSFFYVRLFLYRFFRLLYGATQDGPRWTRLLWFPFDSDIQISISYSVAVFSTKSFRLFLNDYCFSSLRQ